ncbi:hypothetical protein QBC43DRAFT_293829 [Cladorrhinum sp. PSN259]|nr:hypothetical protein QBC43DRAFT_293829 [Cladorrhinum sp. PSN259]
MAKNDQLSLSSNISPHRPQHLQKRQRLPDRGNPNPISRERTDSRKISTLTQEAIVGDDQLTPASTPTISARVIVPWAASAPSKDAIREMFEVLTLIKEWDWEGPKTRADKDSDFPREGMENIENLYTLLQNVGCEIWEAEEDKRPGIGTNRRIKESLEWVWVDDEPNALEEMQQQQQQYEFGLEGPGVVEDSAAIPRFAFSVMVDEEALKNLEGGGDWERRGYVKFVDANWKNGLSREEDSDRVREEGEEEGEVEEVEVEGEDEYELHDLSYEAVHGCLRRFDRLAPPFYYTNTRWIFGYHQY